MKHRAFYTTTIFIFIFLVFARLLGIYYSNIIMANSLPMRQDADFYRHNVSTLILGDSHAQTGLNSEIIGDAYNYASGGENYIQTYYKLKHVLENGSMDIKTVTLSYDMIAFSSMRSHVLRNSFYWGKYVDYFELGLRKGELFSYLTEYLRSRFFPYSGELKNITRYVKSDPNVEFLDFGGQFTRRIVKGYMPNEGDFSQKNKLSAVYKKALENFENREHIDDDLVYYFNRIIDLCAERGIKIILIKFPMTDEYYSAASKKMDVENYYEELNLFIQGRPDIYLLDYHDIFFDKDHLFSNPDHLNTLGATELSKLLKEQLLSMGIR